MLGPRNAHEAIDALLEHCPEFQPAWTWSEWEVEEEQGDSQLSFTVWCHVLLPFFDFAFPFPRPEGPPYAVEHWVDHRHWVDRQFATDPTWSLVPQPGPRLDDLVRRLFEVLDRWADSPSEGVRYYVDLEMVIDGVMSQEDLDRHAGPVLREVSRLYRSTPSYSTFREIRRISVQHE